MAKKGMSMTMQLVIVVIILLIAAMVVLSIFGVQFGGISDTIGTWIGGIPDQPAGVSCTGKGFADCQAGGLACRTCCSPQGVPPIPAADRFSACIPVTEMCPSGTGAC